MVRLPLPTLFAATLAFSSAAWGGEADVLSAQARCSDHVCTISATLQHADNGWDHYADYWRVLAPDGTEIARRVLIHPHEHEQPFTRSLSGIAIPAGLDHVFIEAHDKVHGYGGKRFRLDLK
jgi:hypothetical protein